LTILLRYQIWLFMGKDGQLEASRARTPRNGKLTATKKAWTGIKNVRKKPLLRPSSTDCFLTLGPTTSQVNCTYGPRVPSQVTHVRAPVARRPGQTDVRSKSVIMSKFHTLQVRFSPRNSPGCLLFSFSFGRKKLFHLRTRRRRTCTRLTHTQRRTD